LKNELQFIALVEAAGIEPLSTVNPNRRMVHDFGFYGVKNIELPHYSNSRVAQSRSFRSKLTNASSGPSWAAENA